MPLPLTQEILEALWDGRSPHPNGPGPDRWLILFSSQRCAPCTRLNKAVIEEAAADADLAFFLCDATTNTYTPLYCNVMRYPTFQIMKPGKVVATLTSSDTAAVLDWILSNKDAE